MEVKKRKRKQDSIQNKTFNFHKRILINMEIPILNKFQINLNAPIEVYGSVTSRTLRKLRPTNQPTDQQTGRGPVHSEVTLPLIHVSVNLLTSAMDIVGFRTRTKEKCLPFLTPIIFFTSFLFFPVGVLEFGHAGECGQKEMCHNT